MRAYRLYLCMTIIGAFGLTTVRTVIGVYQMEVVKLNALQLILGIIGERFSLRAALVAVGIITSPGLLILALGLKHSAPPASARPQEEIV